MQLVVHTENINCYLALYQECRHTSIKCVMGSEENYAKGIEMNNSTVLLILEKDNSIYKQLKNKIGIIINEKYWDNGMTDKYNQYLVIKNNNLPYIPTYLYNELDGIDLTNFISKPKFGSMGRDVLMCNKHTVPTPPFIYQPFIENNGDWRVVVIDHKAVSMILRKGETHVNNLAKGAVGWADWDEEAADLAEKCSIALDLDYGGIDIIKDKNTNKYYFLEANSTPTFDTSQILTGINISAKLIEYLFKKFNALVL